MPYFTHCQRRLFYREQGQGPLLLILHGNTASSAAHVGELAYFGQSHHGVVLDFPGTGQSERVDVWSDEWWLQGAWAAVALMDQLSVAQGIVMGTSAATASARLTTASSRRSSGPGPAPQSRARGWSAPQHLE